MFASFLLMLLMCLFSIVGYGKEVDLRQVPSNRQPNSATSIFSKALKQKATNVAKSLKSFRAETSAVSAIKLNGVKIHVADYPDGTRILTCLDGSLKGLQEVYFNGALILSSCKVKWHSKYFVHTYPNGKITSYPKKQIADIY